MTPVSWYHAGSRSLQDQFDSRRIADRLAEVQLHTAFTDEDRAFIERSPMFFLATADLDGRPDCSHKGGLPGFVRVEDERTLTFPDYDGNGMFRSLGNISVNPWIGVLFIDFTRPRRLRVNGTATLHPGDPLLAEYPGARLIVRVHAEQVFPNCPRYIPHLELVEHSVYVPRSDSSAPVPEWKAARRFRDALPARDLEAGPAGPCQRSGTECDASLTGG